MADSSPFLNENGKRRIQSIARSCLYYGQAIDRTILTALNDIGSQQAKPTENKKIDTDWLLDYCHTYPDTVLLFRASDIVLYVDSDAA